jgi:TorA maturation chaperone TorD
MWFAQAGRKWPLFDAALAFSQLEDDPAIREAVVQIAAIPAENMRIRRKRYNQLLEGQSQPLPFYESLAREGRISGASTFKVAALYHAVGLTTNAYELPDHVSVELGFLAFLFEQEGRGKDAVDWRKASKLFLKNHAGQWMPSLGRAISRSDDLVYAPIGRLLTATLEAELRPPKPKNAKMTHALPVIADLMACNLCGFCVQVCPTQTLAINETFETTSLLVNDVNCISCTKCVRICPTKTMQLDSAEAQKIPRTLFQSERARCPGCDKPTISRAELDEVAAQIGSPRWLEYCLECRTMLF